MFAAVLYVETTLFPFFDFKTVAYVPAHCLVGEAVKVTRSVSLNVI